MTNPLMCNDLEAPIVSYYRVNKGLVLLRSTQTKLPQSPVFGDLYPRIYHAATTQPCAAFCLILLAKFFRTATGFCHASDGYIVNTDSHQSSIPNADVAEPEDSQLWEEILGM